MSPRLVQRPSVVMTAAASSYGPWIYNGLPSRPKPIALAPSHGPR
jgi:hypothetical protein